MKPFIRQGPRNSELRNKKNSEGIKWKKIWVKEHNAKVSPAKYPNDLGNYDPVKRAEAREKRKNNKYAA